MTLRDLFLRLRALATPRRVERELDDELAFHIERETQKHLATGLSPANARARALARFGSVPLFADQCRDARGIGFVDDMTRDIPYALRTFRRAPLAALTIVATVALGLGLVTAVFAIYDVVLLRTDAVQSPGELFAVWMGQGTEGDSDPTVVFTRRDYEAMRRETGVFTDAVAINASAARVEPWYDVSLMTDLAAAKAGTTLPREERPPADPSAPAAPRPRAPAPDPSPDAPRSPPDRPQGRTHGAPAQ